MNAFELPQPSGPIAGSNAGFPARRIYCIGQNHAAHALIETLGDTHLGQFGA